MTQRYAGQTPEQLQRLAARIPTAGALRTAAGNKLGALASKVSGEEHVLTLSREQATDALLNTMRSYDGSHTATGVVKEAMKAERDSISISHTTTSPLSRAMAAVWEDVKNNETDDPKTFEKSYAAALKKKVNEIQGEVDKTGNKDNAEKGKQLISQLTSPDTNSNLKSVRQLSTLADIGAQMDADHGKWAKSGRGLVEAFNGGISTAELREAIDATKTKQGGHLDEKIINDFKTQIEQINKSVEDLQKMLQSNNHNNPSDLALRAQLHQIDQQFSQIAITLRDDNSRELLMEAVGPAEMKEWSEKLSKLHDKVPYDHKLAEMTPDTRMPITLADRFNDIGVNKLPTRKDHMMMNVYAGRQRLQIPIIDDKQPTQLIAFDAKNKEQPFITVEVRERQEDGSYKTRVKIVDDKIDNSGRRLNLSAKEAQEAVREYNKTALKEGRPLANIVVKPDGSYVIDTHNSKNVDLMLNKMLEIQNRRPENMATAKLGEAKEASVTHVPAEPVDVEATAIKHKEVKDTDAAAKAADGDPSKPEEDNTPPRAPQPIG